MENLEFGMWNVEFTLSETTKVPSTKDDNGRCFRRKAAQKNVEFGIWNVEFTLSETTRVSSTKDDNGRCFRRKALRKRMLFAQLSVGSRR